MGLTALCQIFSKKEWKASLVVERCTGGDFRWLCSTVFLFFNWGGGIKAGSKADRGVGGARHKPNRQCEGSSGYFCHVIKTLSSTADSLVLRPAISHLASLRCPPESSSPNPEWHCGPRTIPTAATAASARFPPHLELKWSVPVLQ